MNARIKKAIEKGTLVILLGAGASSSSKDKYGKNLLGSSELGELLANEANISYKGEELSDVYSAAKRILGDEEIEKIFKEKYQHCQPSSAYEGLSKFPWARIYTLNIDDSLDKALMNNSPQKVTIRNRSDKIADQDKLFNELDYIKLNGSITSWDKGIIFSSKEYGKGSANEDLWYQELGRDFFKYTFLFIGTKLKEPLFYHQIERYRAQANSEEPRSYVLTPAATEIEKASLLNDHNIQHISSTLEEFVDWINKTFPRPLSPLDLAMNRDPALKILMEKNKGNERQEFIKTLENVIPITENNLAELTSHSYGKGKIRDFYKGFKPTWQDIIDDVPANLTALTEYYDLTVKNLSENKKLSVLYGPAGSGKTTLIKQIAYKFLKEKPEQYDLFFIEKPIDNLKEIIIELEKISKKYLLFYDKIDLIAKDVAYVIEEKLIEHGSIIASESQNIWSNRTKYALKKYCGQPYELSLINDEDAEKILEKIEKFGPWTRLSKLSPQKRKEEILNRSKRQLLIGLFEATSGIGYEQIIENEFSNLETIEEKTFLVLVGLATMHKLYIKESYVQRALTALNIDWGVADLSRKMEGIIHHGDDRLLARHPVYIRHLFDQAVNENLLFDSINALLSAYTVYEAPVIKHVGKNESTLFKAIINHKFLKDIFRSQEKTILSLYQSFEKHFEIDGLYWLQYGLSLRGFGYQTEAYEKIQTAYDAYPQPHTEHALAQQELIMGLTSDSKEKAYNFLERAKDRLERLDLELRNTDAYPIVTLSEGHTKIVNKFDPAEGSEIAKHYVNSLQERLKDNHDIRVKQCWEKLFHFSVSGIWNQDKDDEIFLVD